MPAVLTVHLKVSAEAHEDEDWTEVAERVRKCLPKRIASAASESEYPGDEIYITAVELDTAEEPDAS